MASLVLTREFQADWFKIPLLGETEAMVRPRINSWWGLAQVISFGGCRFLFNHVFHGYVSVGGDIT